VNGIDPSGNEGTFLETLGAMAINTIMFTINATKALMVKKAVKLFVGTLALAMVFKITKAISHATSSYWVVFTPSDSGEAVYLECPTAKEVRDQLQTYKTAGKKLSSLLIRGHGSPDAIFYSKDRTTDCLTYANGGFIIDSDNVDLTSLFKDVMMVDGLIVLNGCTTAINSNNPLTTTLTGSNENLAKNISTAIPDVNVRGSVGYLLPVPFTTSGVSNKATYKNGVKASNGCGADLLDWLGL